MCSIGRRDEIQLVISNKRDISLSRRYREGIGGDKTKNQNHSSPRLLITPSHGNERALFNFSEISGLNYIF